MFRILSVTILYFNSRPCERGDLAVLVAPVIFDQFQFTPLREGRRMCGFVILLVSIFQFTPLREGRPNKDLPFKGSRRKFQFTPLREGRLRPFRPAATPAQISIHAPARGATVPVPCRVVSPSDFNSRPCERGDGTRKVTNKQAYYYFNSRPCERGDKARRLEVIGRANFNSRPCERGDLLALFYLVPLLYFNSRPCERGDSAPPFVIRWRFLFQFTPLREGRLAVIICTISSKCISIHAPARGATLAYLCIMFFI